MTIKELLISLNACGIQIYLDEGKLKTKSQPGAITEEIAKTIRERKDELISLLSSAAPQTQAAPLLPVADTDRGTLSFAQQRLWFLDQFGNGSAHYNMPAVLRLTGVLNRQALQATLDEIVRRHEVLRTTYRKTSTGGVQQVAPPPSVAVSFVDLSGARDDEQQARIDALMGQEVSTPFDLAQDLMIRVSLAQLSADSYMLFLTLHHIAADGWSQGILVSEFIALYQAFVEGGEPSLPKLPIQYADYAHWQRQAMSSEPMQRHLAFWRDEMAGVAQLHNIPTDRLRSPQLETAGQSFRCTVDAQLLGGLSALATRHGASLFMVLHAAFALLLARWSGDEDIVVGTPVAGRDRKETEGLIGCFINTLALRSRCRPGMSFEQFLVQSRTSTLHAYEHQQVPFEMVVEDLNPPRSLSHSPLFQVMLALQNYEVGALQLPGLAIEELPVDGQNTKYDITILATEGEGSLRMLWTYADGLFEPSTIQSMASSYLNLLAAIVVEPEQDIYRLPLLTAEQAAELDESARAGHGHLVRDSFGALQPRGAAGRVILAKPDTSSKGAAWRETGDIGYLRSNGDIEVLRHQDDAATINGHRIATTVVEAELLASGLVDSAVVRTHQPAGAGAATLAGYVVPSDAGREGLEGLAESCRDAMRARVPDFMLPALFVVMESLPLLPDGAVDIARLPEPVYPVTAKAAPVPPSHALEKQLCEIWCSVLSLESVGIHDSFFDVGGSSLHIIIVQQEILSRTGQNIDVTDLFTYPTIAGLAKYLQDREHAEPSSSQNSRISPSGGIAIIGMAGRFPDARDVDTFWENIKSGRESLTVFTDEELLGAGVSPEQLTDRNYVKSGVVLEGLREFDAAYFGFTPREVEVMDPQQRLLFECAVEALEQAGYGDDATARPVGVYLGTGESQYLFENLLPQSALLESVRLAAMHGNRPDYVATRLSHRLNLSGPSINIGTACSTSLVAVHEACQALLDGECEMALTGGASIQQLGPRGYHYQEGFILSADGHCRAFDKDAAGTRSGSGAALVLLKRLEDSLAEGDTIHAVIKGSAINNDGAEKVGYTAPSVLGQAQVIARAQAVAGVAAESIGYVETHGTGTQLGDPIEIRALAKSFAGAPKQSCALGAVKPNIGHLDSAAGVAGLIKTVKVLSERQIPPTVNFHQSNPQIDFANSPFYVNTELKPWHSDDGAPRRAGVSSFGIGGTNAHVVLEEAPERTSSASGRNNHLIALSAKTETALAQASSNLLTHLRQQNSQTLVDIAYTLQVGRAAHVYRRAFVATSIEDAIGTLAVADSLGLAKCEEGDQPSVVFMFTGQGSQYVNMGRDLYRTESVFKDVIDRCAELLLPEMEFDLRDVLMPEDGADLDQIQRRLARTEVAQPALFALEYGVAHLLMHWGVQPAAMIGHSLGEYVAACIAGVFSLEDGLRLVARRGRLMQSAAAGRMLSVSLGESEAAQLFASANCCLAAVNSPKDCVASGTEDAIRSVASHLDERGVACRELPTGHAFHSTMMESIQAPFRSLLEGISLRPPKLPYISNVTGEFIRSEDATDPDYWVRHLLGTVRFAQGIEFLAVDMTLLRPKRIFLEVGPGLALCSLARKNAKVQPWVVVSSIRHAQEDRADDGYLLKAVGQLWTEGVRIDWRALHAGAGLRVPLPTYPFERKHFWIEKNSQPPTMMKTGRMNSPADWFYVPAWKQLAPASQAAVTGGRTADALWLVLSDDTGIGEEVRSQLEARGYEVVLVRTDERYARVGEREFTCTPSVEEDYRRLLREIGVANERAIRVVHLWSVTHSASLDAQAAFAQAQPLGLHSLLYLARSIASACPASAVTVDLVTNSVLSVTGEESIAAPFGTTLGLSKVIPQEFPQFSIHHLDINCRPGVDAAGSNARLGAMLVSEATAEKRPLQVAMRGSKRWGMSYEPCSIEVRQQNHAIGAGGNYVITGGLGNIGLLLAEHLAARGAAGLMLISRRAYPSVEEWPGLSHADFDGDTRSKMDRLSRLAAAGIKIRLYAGDVASHEHMQEAFEIAERELGAIDGVIHGAGKVHGSMLALEDITTAVCEEHFGAKVAGTHVLERILAQKNVRFCLLMSSLSSVLGGLGFGAYSAANSYLDAFAQRKHNEGDHRWFSVNWDGWIFGQKDPDQAGMSPTEGVEAFDQALRLSHLPQVVNSTSALEGRIAQWLLPQSTPRRLESLHPRPTVQTTYVEPRSETEQRLAAIWQNVLGIEQIGVRDNFFELGGDSVILVQVHKAIRAGINADVAVANLFQFPSIAELATYLDRQNGGAVAESIVSKRMGRRRARGGSPKSAPA